MAAPSYNAGGPCQFAYPVVAGTQDFGDGNWIKAYNGASAYFESWITSGNHWNTNDDGNYVHAVCGAPVL